MLLFAAIDYFLIGQREKWPIIRAKGTQKKVARAAVLDKIAKYGLCSTSVHMAER